MDLYKYAAQNGLRFPSRKGDLTAEQLFQLPLKSATGVDLDTVARTINTSLKGVSEESFVEDTSSDPKKTALAVALDIVKDVIRTKQEANKAAAERTAKNAQLQKVLDVLAQRKDQKLTQASDAELEAMLKELRG